VFCSPIMRPYLILVGLLYTVVGFGTGEFARSSPRMGNLWRFAGWALKLRRAEERLIP